MNTVTKKLKWLFFLLLTSFFFASCHQSVLEQQLGDWQSKAGFLGLGRNGAVSFVINNKAYVGTGFNRDNNIYLQDFFVYDANLNKWDSIAPFPGPGRQNAVAFSINGKGYVGTGAHGTADGNIEELKDFYSYDPVADKWTQLADLPGSVRRGATAFVLNNKGYVGTGISTAITGVTNGMNDFYVFDPTSGWSVAPNYPGPKVFGAFSFVINNKAYVGGGTIGAGASFPDNQLWAFDPDAPMKWTKQHSLDSLSTQVKRMNCASFSYNDRGYVVCGAAGTSVTSTVFEFNPSNQIWTQKTDYESTQSAARTECVGFVIPSSNGNGYSCYVGLGTPNSNASPLDDFMALSPLVTRLSNN